MKLWNGVFPQAPNTWYDPDGQSLVLEMLGSKIPKRLKKCANGSLSTP